MSTFVLTERKRYTINQRYTCRYHNETKDTCQIKYMHLEVPNSTDENLELQLWKISDYNGATSSYLSEHLNIMIFTFKPQSSAFNCYSWTWIHTSTGDLLRETSIGFKEILYRTICKEDANSSKFFSHRSSIIQQLHLSFHPRNSLLLMKTNKFLK